MKANEKASLIAAVIGLIAGGVFHFMTPEIHWGFHLSTGLLLAALTFQGAAKLLAGEKIPAKDKGAFAGLLIGLAAGVATFYGISGAHWGFSVVVGVVVFGCCLQADLAHRAMSRQAGDS